MTKPQPPEGEAAPMFEEFEDLGGDLGVVYRKRGEGPWRAPVAAGPAFFFPRCASLFSLRGPGQKRAQTVDAYAFVVAAAGVTLDVRGVTSISDAVLLHPSPALLARVGAAYRIDVARRLADVAALAVLPRTNWLNEIMHRLVYERVVARNRANTATAFLEEEIVKEVHYRFEQYDLRDKSRFDLDSLSLDLRSPTVRLAMSFIDANLFREITVRQIAHAANVSESTLLREFRRYSRKTPLAYLLDRRLDEAMVLMKSQRYSVNQVADLVGYENASAFISAFKRRFGMTPAHTVWKDPASLAVMA